MRVVQKSTNDHSMFLALIKHWEAALYFIDALMQSLNRFAIAWTTVKRSKDSLLWLCKKLLQRSLEFS